MATLETRLINLANAIGADVKALRIADGDLVGWIDQRLQEQLVGIHLRRQQVWHRQDAGTLAEILADALLFGE